LSRREILEARGLFSMPEIPHREKDMKYLTGKKTCIDFHFYEEEVFICTTNA